MWRKIQTRKYLIVIILTLLASGIVFKVYNAEPIKNEKLYSFPLTIGQWIGKELPMEDWVYASLGTPYAILRDYYSTNGEKINLAIVWYDDRNISFHAPEACLGGIGNKIKEKTIEHMKINDIVDIQIARFIVEQNSLRQLLLYYYICDNTITSQQTKIRKKILFKRLQSGRSSAAFIRIMMPIHERENNTRIVLENFLRLTYPIITEYTDTERIQLYNLNMRK